MVKKRGLGKPLDALLAYTSTELETNETLHPSSEKLCDLPLNQIQRGKYQPRRDMDPEALEELASSIRAQGIIQPLIVRPVGDTYEIIAGERRFRAAKLAGLSSVPVIIRHIPDEAAIAIALIENIQRENLNPIDEALALLRLIEELGMTHEQVAKAVGKSRASVSNLLRLLSLPDEIKALLTSRDLEMGHARALLSLKESVQIEAAKNIAANRLSVRETESLVRRLQAGPTTKTQTPLEPNLIQLQQELCRQLKLRVAIQCNKKGKGKLVIHYRSLAELDSLLAQFN